MQNLTRKEEELAHLRISLDDACKRLKSRSAAPTLGRVSMIGEPLLSSEVTVAQLEV